MKAFLVLIIVAIAGLLSAFALARGTPAANPKLIGNVGPGATISLTDAGGHPVTSLAAGTYDIEVTDQSAFHNFDLKAPGGTTVQATDVSGSGTVTWTVTLTTGTWTFLCDAHPYDMNGSFTVSNSATTTTATTATSSTTGTTTAATTVATTVPPPTSVEPPPPPPIVRVVVRCSVPRLRGKTVAAARALLRRRHCALGSVRRAYSARFKAGIIIGQRPAAGVRRARGARVSVTVSRGPRR